MTLYCIRFRDKQGTILHFQCDAENESNAVKQLQSEYEMCEVIKVHKGTLLHLLDEESQQ